MNKIIKNSQNEKSRKEKKITTTNKPIVFPSSKYKGKSTEKEKSVALENSLFSPFTVSRPSKFKIIQKLMTEHNTFTQSHVHGYKHTTMQKQKQANRRKKKTEELKRKRIIWFVVN